MADERSEILSGCAVRAAEQLNRLAPFQGRVAPFMEHCFGPEISADSVERYHRFIEESLELAQSLGCSAADAHMLVAYVFGRPIGKPHQEAGGVMVTLAALCLAVGIDMHQAGEDELRRVWTMIDVIREKQKNKPRNSPLPASGRSEPDCAFADRIERELKELKALKEDRGDSEYWVLQTFVANADRICAALRASRFATGMFDAVQLSEARFYRNTKEPIGILARAILRANGEMP